MIIKKMFKMRERQHPKWTDSLIYQMECEWVVSSSIFPIPINCTVWTVFVIGFFLQLLFFCLFQFFNWLFLLHMFLFSFHLFDGAPFRAIGFFQSICNNKMPADLMGNDDSNRTTTTTSTAAPASTVKNNICHKVNWFWCESMIVKSTSNER